MWTTSVSSRVGSFKARYRNDTRRHEGDDATLASYAQAVPPLRVPQMLTSIPKASAIAALAISA